MPQVVVGAALTAGVSTVFASAATIAAGGAFLGLAAGTAGAFFATSFTTSLVLGGLSQALAKKPSMGTTLATSGQTVTAKSPIASANIIYGRTRVGGTIVHMEATSSNKYLHLVIAVAGHEIDAFETVYFDDEALTLDAGGVGYGGKARIKFKLGTDDQTAFSELVSESGSGWSNNHRLRGRACAYVRLEYDQDKFPNGVPNISFVVRGKKVFDPRTNTTAWSANPALCLNDYLTNTRYGLGCVYASEIDEAALEASANICDEAITLAAGGTEARYAAHGAISTANTPQDIISSILSSMAGKAVFSGGKWRILAGAYYSPTLTFDEDDLRAGFRVQSLVSRRENFNCIKGVFSSVDENYIVTDFPPIISSTFIAQDNGEAVYKNIELPLTTSASMAQRLAKIELLKARQQITVTLPMKLHGLQANVGDIVRINNTRMGWSSKPFEVVSMQMALGETLGVDLELREISLDVFDWSTSEEQAYDPAPNTNFPDPFNVGIVTSLSASASNAVMSDGSIQPQLVVTWTPPADAFVVAYDVQWLPQGATNYFSVIVNEPTFTIPNIDTNKTYTIRVRAINTIGARSAFVAINDQSTVGDTLAPAIPTVLTASGAYRQINLSWVNPSDKDFSHVEVWRHTSNDSASAAKIATINASSYSDGSLPIGTTYWYWLKAVDLSGNTSGFSTAATTSTTFIDDTAFENGINSLFVDQGLYAILDVATLPVAGDYANQKVFDRSTGKLYEWTGSVWRLVIAEPDTFIASDKIVANTITGGLLATSGIITSSAQINDAVITNAKIENAAVTTLKIGGEAVSTTRYNVFDYSPPQMPSTLTTLTTYTANVAETGDYIIIVNMSRSQIISGFIYGSSSITQEFELLIDGVQSVYGINTFSDSAVPVNFGSRVRSLSAGSHTFVFKYRYTGTNVTLTGSGITQVRIYLFGAYR